MLKDLRELKELKGLKEHKVAKVHKEQQEVKGLKELLEHRVHKGHKEQQEAKVLKVLQEIRGNQRVTTDNPEATYAALEKYGIDLVAQARKGKMDPVIGRDDDCTPPAQEAALRSAQ